MISHYSVAQQTLVESSATIAVEVNLVKIYEGKGM